MAINKNFVIKNGVQVSTDLIIGDADTNRVGVGTTVPGYDLHIGIGRKSRGGIGATDLVVTGVATVTNVNVTGLSTFAGALDVNGTVDFSKDVVFNGTSDITYDQSESALVFNDGAAIRVGTSSDFSISHDGNNTILRENGTGDLQIYASRIELGGASVDETTAVFTENGAAELWFNNTKRFETVGHGATVFGDLIVSGVTTSQKLNVTGVATVGGALSLGDNIKAQFGTGGDLLIYHDSSNSYIDDQGTGDLIIRGSADIKLQSASGENYIIANDTGSVEAYFDNSKKVETTSGGLNVTGITTFSDRINVVSGVSTFQDNAKLTFGAQSDLIVYHSGSHSFIQDTTGTGNLYIDSNSLQIRNAAGDETQATFAENGAVSLFYDDGNVFQTTPQGVNVSGVTTSNRLNISGVSTFTSVGSNLIPDVDGSRNIGAATSEWGDLFVDGTAHIDTLDVDESAFVTTTLTVGTGLTVHPHGTVAIAGITTIGGNLLAGGDILPDDDGARDLGSSSKEFQDLFIDGTANIDTLAADTAAIGDLTADRVVIAGTSGELEDDANFTFDGAMLKVGTAATIAVNGNAAFAGIVTVGGDLNVIGDIVYDEITGRNLNITGITTLQSQANFGGTLGIGATVFTNGNVAISGITTVGGALLVGAGITVSGDILPNADGSRDLGSATLEFQDLFIDGTANIDSLAADSAAIGDLTADRVVIAGTSGELEDDANFTYDGSILKIAAGAGASIHNTGNAAFVGVVTAGRGFNIGIQSAGIVVAKNVGISSLNFIGAGNSITYHAASNTLGIDIAGSGGGGGVSETSTSVSSTSATSCGTFDKTEKRSAAVLAQIKQGSAYQIGRYLLIHDGTTVTTIEESAIATGSMLGTFEGVINGDNVEFRVTMSSSSSATVITKIDSISV